MLLGLKGRQVASRNSACLLRALKPFLGAMRRKLMVFAMQLKLEIISHVTCLHPDIDEVKVESHVRGAAGFTLLDRR